MSKAIEKRRQGRLKRKSRVRRKVRGTEIRPRLTVFRSAKHIYAQVVDDERGVTLAAASTREAGSPSSSKKVDAAREVGERLAEKCLSGGIGSVVFDRNGFLYHGRVAAVAEGARNAGLQF